jgi:hypothetical protein
MRRIILSLAGFVVLFGLIAPPVQSVVPAAVQAEPTSPARAQPEAETFLGTILKDGDKFVLSDSATSLDSRSTTRRRRVHTKGGR